MTAVLLALLLAADGPVALRPDRPTLTQPQAAAMSPAALADALLAPGHPPITERVMLPGTFVPPPPPPFRAPLDVRLIAAATFDAPSGFCLKRSWRVSGTPEGRPTALAPEPTLYRLPPATGGCEAEHRSFFGVAAADRPRAFTVVHLLAALAHNPGRVDFPVGIDDQEGRAMAAYCHGRPAFCNFPVTVITSGRRALADLPVQAIAYVCRHSLLGADLLSPADLTGPDGQPRESWQVFVGGEYTVQLALDGDRIVAMKLRRSIPPPF